MLSSGLYAIPALVGAFLVVGADRSGSPGVAGRGGRRGRLLRHPHGRGPVRHRCAGTARHRAKRMMEGMSHRHEAARARRPRERPGLAGGPLPRPARPSGAVRTRSTGRRPHVAARLRDAGCEVHEGVGGTGVVGIVRNGDGPTVLVRADMDALPVREETGLPYASTQTAEDGTPVMHACGHDVHVACLLGAVALLARHPRTGGPARSWRCSSRPRRRADGAKGMLDDGLASLVGDRRRRDGPARAAVPRRHRRDAAAARPCRPPTACGSPCTVAAPTGRCRRPRSTRSCSPP